jgi:hypothetical protein
MPTDEDGINLLELENSTSNYSMADAGGNVYSEDNSIIVEPCKDMTEEYTKQEHSIWEAYMHENNSTAEATTVQLSSGTNLCVTPYHYSMQQTVKGPITALIDFERQNGTHNVLFQSLQEVDILFLSIRDGDRSSKCRCFVEGCLMGGPDGVVLTHIFVTMELNSQVFLAGIYLSLCVYIRHTLYHTLYHTMYHTMYHTLYHTLSPTLYHTTYLTLYCKRYLAPYHT